MTLGNRSLKKPDVFIEVPSSVLIERDSGMWIEDAFWSQEDAGLWRSDRMSKIVQEFVGNDWELEL
tara:strand:+ start:128 stop:325 length:198 start_codon:yes stop_codon:yes gene_type:complete